MWKINMVFLKLHNSWVVWAKWKWPIGGLEVWDSNSKNIGYPFGKL
jgi:hypothetical protein